MSKKIIPARMGKGSFTSMGVFTKQKKRGEGPLKEKVIGPGEGGEWAGTREVANRRSIDGKDIKMVRDGQVNGKKRHQLVSGQATSLRQGKTEGLTASGRNIDRTRPKVFLNKSSRRIKDRDELRHKREVRSRCTTPMYKG